MEILLALMTVGQTGGALLLPVLARHEDRRKLLMLALALQLIGFCGFIWLPQQLPLAWAICCGIGLGGAFPLCLVLALDHAKQVNPYRFHRHLAGLQRNQRHQQIAEVRAPKEQF